MNPVTEAYLRFYTIILLGIFSLFNIIYYRAWIIAVPAMAAMLLVAFLPMESETEEYEYEAYH